MAAAGPLIHALTHSPASAAPRSIDSDTRVAVESFVARKRDVDRESEAIRSGFADAPERWSADSRVLAERAQRRYRELALAGHQIIGDLIECYGSEHVKTRMIRALTLRCVNESSQWGLKLLLSGSKAR